MTQKTRRRRIIGIIMLIVVASSSLAYWAYRRKRVDLDLLDAIYSRDVAAARAALSAGANPNALGYPFSSMREQPSAYEQILSMIARTQSGAKPVLRDAPSTALMLAVEAGQSETVQMLLDHGANPNVHGTYGMTPLMYAADRGRIQMIDALLRRHADLNARLQNGQTALTVALSQNHLDIVRRLLDAGADVKQQSATDKSPVLIAISTTSTPIELLRRLLTAGANVNARNPHGETPLILTEQIASQVQGTGQVVQVRGMRNGMSYVQTVTVGPGGTVSIAQLQQDRKDRVRALLAHGADVNAANRTGETALMRAVQNGDADDVKLLLAHGANVNPADDFGKTALMQAAEHGYDSDIEMLLAHGAQVNAANRAGETALMSAAWIGALPCAQQLIAHGANVNRIDRSRKASSLPFDEFRPTVDAMNFDSGTALMRTASTGSVPMIQLLLAHGVNVNQADPCGETALMRAAERGALEVVQLLLAHGADARAVDRAGRTAVMFAALSAPAKHTYSVNSAAPLPPNLNRAQFQAQWQTSVRMQNQQASRWPNGTQLQRYLQIMQLFLSHGADVNARDRHGDTTLKLAMSPGKPVPDPSNSMSLGSPNGVVVNISPLLVLVQRPEIVAALKRAGARSR